MPSVCLRCSDDDDFDDEYYDDDDEYADDDDNHHHPRGEGISISHLSGVQT